MDQIYTIIINLKSFEISLKFNGRALLKCQMQRTHIQRQLLFVIEIHSWGREETRK